MEYWLECDCPSGADFDVFPGEPNFGGPDHVVECSMCGGRHVAGDIGQMLLIDTNGEVRQLSHDQWRDLLASKPAGSGT